MPFNIDYTPMGALGGLAMAAGQAEGAKAGAQLALQYAHLAQQQEQFNADLGLRSQAMQLQQAQAQRMAQKAIPPAGDHIQERALLQRQERERNQGIAKAQLDRMLESKTIDPAHYQQALLGIMSGDDNAITSVIASMNKKDPMDKATFQAKTQMHRDKRKALVQELLQLNKDPLAAIADEAGHAAKVAEIKKKLDAEDANEAGLLGGDDSDAALEGPAGGAGTPAGDPLEGRVIVNRQTGERRVRQAGKWVPIQ
jgi:hypothetical protein